MFNLVEFMICDKDGGGTMSEDECMEVIAESLFLMSCMRGKECTEVSTDMLLPPDFVSPIWERCDDRTRQ